MMRFETHADGDASLRAKDLTCRRAGRLLFKGLNYDFIGGQIVALRGDNGSGKTSLLRLMAGLLAPFSGQVSGAHTHQLHYIAHQNGLKTRMTVLENLTFWGRWLAPQNKIGMAPEPALNMAGLHTHMDLMAGDLSAGQKRRLSLARLLVAPRPVWLLDEPDTALDEKGQSWLRDMMGAQKAANGLVIVATHAPLAVADTYLTLGETGAEIRQ